MGGPFALDYNAVLATGAAAGVDMTLLAEMLPIAEASILSQFDKEDDDET